MGAVAMWMSLFRVVLNNNTVLSPASVPWKARVRHTFGHILHMRSIALLALFAFVGQGLHAQAFEDRIRAIPVDSPSTAGNAEGAVTIHTDPRVERLMKDYTEHKHVLKGYRVQIFLGDRKTAEDTKHTFLQRNPETPAYLSWLAPNFRLRVGDLHTRLEAEKLLHDMRVDYPGSYIVPDDIEMPRLPGER